ncbi:MAG TPA: DUF6209 family protein [Myxococcales bacterium]|jgi:hypothetical protein
MAGNTKNGKTPAAPAKKVAEKAPVAKAAPPAAEVKPVAAKPADTKPALKTAAPAPKAVAAPAPAPAPVAKPVEAKPAAAAPAPKAEAKPVEKAPAKPIAHVSFGPSWKQTIEGELVSGGQVTLSYDPGRAQLRHKNGDKPAWGVQAFVKLVPSGQLVEQPAVDFNGSGAKARPVTVELPKGTTEIQVWFKNWATAEKPGEAWDSNFGLNYKFAVRA